MPERIQLRRTAGWRMPPNTLKVDRTTKFGNPFEPGKPNPLVPGATVADRRHAYLLFKAHAPLNPALVAAARAELRGFNLGCWCPPPEIPGGEDCCHASILLEISNAD